MRERNEYQVGLWSKLETVIISCNSFVIVFQLYRNVRIEITYPFQKSLNHMPFKSLRSILKELKQGSVSD